MKLPTFRFLSAVVLLTLLVGCARAPDLVGYDNPVTPVASVKESTKRKIFLITTREASDVNGVFYSDQRAPNLGFAAVTVSIPPNHVPGALERPQHLPPDPETEFAIVEPVVFGSNDVFVSRINRELAKLPPKDRDVLLFIHGYNNTVSDSILRIAQFAEDTGFKGVPVLFSWASAGKVSRYVYDLNSALVARNKLDEASGYLARTNAKGFSVFAHSMGAFLLMETIVASAQKGDFNQTGRLDNVMLAAPDIDLDLFREQISQIPEDDRDFFVFVSAEDSVLRFSRRISGGVQRVGAAHAAELADLGVNVIDLSQVDDSTSGAHSKFAGSPEVVQLIGKSLKQDNFNKPSQTPTLVEILDGVPILSELTP